MSSAELIIFPDNKGMMRDFLVIPNNSELVNFNDKLYRVHHKVHDLDKDKIQIWVKPENI